MWLTAVERKEQKICAGKFGYSGKMIIKPYSIPPERRDSILKVFTSLVRISICGCWEWQGRIHNDYPCCPIPGGSTRWAHRVSYALFNGPIAEQMHVDHKCRNRKCVRPDHLEQMPPIENYKAIQRRRLRDIKRAREEAGQMNILSLLGEGKG